MNTNLILELQKEAERAWPELDLLIGWGAGFDELHTTPVFVRDPGGIEKLVWNPFCVQNLSGYLVKGGVVEKVKDGKKIGIFVKGCDSRSLVALLQEKLIEREKLFILGVPCRGAIDWRKLASGVSAIEIEGDRVRIEKDDGTQHFALEDLLFRKCKRCRHPNPVIHDVLIGEEVAPRAGEDDLYRDVLQIEQLPLEQRLSFWQEELDRCMRCYACRNACPLCVCQDRCIAETRDPKWLTQYMDLPEKYMFHFIHAMHLAGRCTECGECERVCPMEIPVTLIKEELNKIVKELLAFEPGIDPSAVPPLLTFNPGETGI